MERSNLTRYLKEIKEKLCQGLKIPSEEDPSSKDYRTYRLSSKEKREYYLAAFAFCMVIGMLFYDSITAGLLLLCISPYFEDRYADHLREKRKENMLGEFKDALYSISASIAAGRQLPRAIEDAASSIGMFIGESSILYPELLDIAKRYKQQNASIEQLLSDLGERSGIEEIKLFASSCSICRRCGGDLEEVCLKSAYILIEKIEYGKEARAVLAEKKIDTLIMLIMPAAVLFFLNISSYSYIKPLYGSLAGRILMTAALILITIAALWSLKIMRLEL